MLRRDIEVPDARCRKEKSQIREACRRAKAAPKPSAPQRRSARCRNGTWPISIPRMTRRRSNAISNAPTQTLSPSRRPTRESSPRWRPAPMPGRSSPTRCKRYEALDDLLGRLISFAGLFYAGNTTDPVRGEILWRHAGAHHGDFAASAVLHARTQPARRCARLTPRWRIPRSAITGRGSRTCARKSRTSSKIASRSCSTRSR